MNGRSSFSLKETPFVVECLGDVIKSVLRVVSKFQWSMQSSVLFYVHSILSRFLIFCQFSHWASIGYIVLLIRTLNFIYVINTNSLIHCFYLFE